MRIANAAPATNFPGFIVCAFFALAPRASKSLLRSAVSGVASDDINPNLLSTAKVPAQRRGICPARRAIYGRFNGGSISARSSPSSNTTTVPGRNRLEEVGSARLRRLARALFGRSVDEAAPHRDQMNCKAGHLYSQHDIVGDPQACIMGRVTVTGGGVARCLHFRSKPTSLCEPVTGKTMVRRNISVSKSDLVHGADHE